MGDSHSLLTAVMNRALELLEQQSFALYTLAFYLDHESSAIAICADTQPNSDRVVAEINRYNLRHFLDAIREADLSAAALWQANVGRSLSLGDFTAVNLARTELGDVPVDVSLCHAMVDTVIKNHSRIRKLSPNPAHTLLATSTLEDEVGLIWSLPASDL